MPKSIHSEKPPLGRKRGMVDTRQINCHVDEPAVAVLEQHCTISDTGRHLQLGRLISTALLEWSVCCGRHKRRAHKKGT